MKREEIGAMVYERIKDIKMNTEKAYHLYEFDDKYPSGTDIAVFDLDGRLVGLVSWTDITKDNEKIKTGGIEKTICKYNFLNDHNTRPVLCACTDYQNMPKPIKLRSKRKSYSTIKLPKSYKVAKFNKDATRDTI